MSCSILQLDVAVLQFQNLKLAQQLEAQKAECSALDNKYQLWKDKQKFYDETLNTVHKTWEQLLSDLESLTISTSWSLGEEVDAKRSQNVAGEQIDFLISKSLSIILAFPQCILECHYFIALLFL